jgi:hypothetical protein
MAAQGYTPTVLEHEAIEIVSPQQLKHLGKRASLMLSDAISLEVRWIFRSLGRS